MTSQPPGPDLVRAPARAVDLGIPLGVAEDLFMRRVLADRITTLSDVARALCVTHAVADELGSGLRDKALLEYLGASGRDYRVQLTERGAQTTQQRMATGRHVGPMPVPLRVYDLVVREQRSIEPVDRRRIRNAFEDMYVEPELLDQLGPAFVNGGAVFLYGPAGTGKTSLAERMNRVFGDPVLIPRYVEVDSQIVTVYDPALHTAVDDPPAGLDPRWVLCERPLILVGGELDLGMLDLRYDRLSGVSVAPISMQANNGILVIDDFGRQGFRPDEILNRWIVPMSRGIDFLKAATGTKFTVPFEARLVFSTNLEPTSLGDEAFLRRLRNKVYIGPISDDGFRWVLAAAARRGGIEVSADAPAHLSTVARRELGELRPYLAVDFCQLTASVCAYEGCPPVLDPPMIDRVAELYFVQNASAEMDVPPAGRWRVPDRPRRDLFTRWNDYQIGHVFDESPLEGLDDLAATLSIEEATTSGEIPEVLRPVARPDHN